MFHSIQAVYAHKAVVIGEEIKEIHCRLKKNQVYFTFGHHLNIKNTSQRTGFVVDEVALEQVLLRRLLLKQCSIFIHSSTDSEV